MKNGHKKIQHGVTLIELAMVLAIIGILASMATPTYREYIALGKRSEALRELTYIASLQEEYFADNLIYADDLPKAFGYTSDPAFSHAYLLANHLYRISITSNDLTKSYTIIATALGSQVKYDSACVKLSINSMGIKSGQNQQGQDTKLTCWQ